MVHGLRVINKGIARRISGVRYRVTPSIITSLTASFIVLYSSTTTAQMANFSSDLKLLKKHFQPIVLQDQERRVAVLGELQGRIMIATAGGDHGESIGWIKRTSLSNGDQPDGSIGGVDRLWFGPDGGALSVFFEPGADTVPDNIRVPAAVNTVKFNTVEQSEQAAKFEQEVRFTNHQGFEFNALVERSVQLLSQQQTSEALSTPIPSDIDWVAYGSSTKVTNISQQAWRQETGLFSIWNLGMFAPSATIIIPLSKPLDKLTSYFENTSLERQLVTESAAFYFADAKSMDKIGIPVEHTKPFMGSYNPQTKMLTVVHFAINDQAPAGYVNAVWDWDAEPYQGEIINVFNDGPQENGKPFGPFYEMETSSRALALKPQESDRHFHNTYHFIGDPSSLNKISTHVLGVTIKDIEKAFKTFANK